MESVVDEAGMCVVNTKSITERISRMATEEFQYVSDISSQFLTHFIRLAHCSDPNNVKDAAFSMLKLLLNNVFNSGAMENKFVSYKSAMKTEASPSKNMGEAIMSSILGSLDPVAILTNILDENGNDALSKGTNGILSLLEGYNPLKLDDFIMLEKCNRGRGCAACCSLHGILIDIDPSHGHPRFPNEALMYLFRCLNHRRFNFGGDIEFARASFTFTQNENNPCVIVVPLRSLLLGCVDFLAGDNAARTLSSICTHSENWVSPLCTRVQMLALQDRAFLSQVYAFFIFSRHRQQSGDCINQFLYTVFARFLYSVTEILFCANENASAEVDGGNFLNYIKAWTNISVMGGTLNTMKAYQLWRNEGSSVAPVLNLFSGNWRSHYTDNEALVRLGVNMANYINSMSKLTRLGGRRKSSTTPASGLDSIRSVRQAEKYIPYGFVEQYRGSLKLQPIGIGFHAKEYSNGNNIPCNCFHILSGIKGGEILGPDNVAVDQAAFKKAITPDGVENGTGKMMGLITSYIDKTILGSSFPNNATEFEKRINKFVKDIIFTKTTIHEESVNLCKSVPDSRTWTNPVVPVTTARCFDTRIYTLFLLWQRPCIQYPNVSALTACQLELMLSRDPKWADFITRIFFIMERVSFQLADAIVKNGCSSGGGLGTIKLCSSTAQSLIDSSLNTVSKDWDFNGGSAKVQYSSRLYELLNKIIIVNDMDPVCVIANSNFVCDYVRFMDELLMKIL